ncbi:MAG: lipoprotein signal peptidase [Prevotellaceae bacterium]|jgi:signal peptidase II|nr:lipoprotein signal peptidase [Prevotellaceae bacterium]
MLTNKKSILAVSTIIIILLIDQVVKILVKTNMQLGDSIHVFGNWFQICFTENSGFAFGMEFGGGQWGKLFLSIVRIFAICIIAWMLVKIIRQKYPAAFIIGIAALLAGAAGNIIDSIFYGQIFSDSYGHVAAIFPEGGGYAPLLQGRVVDMLYFPILTGHFPSWFPFWGGEEFIFFRPIFNIADSAITVSILYIIIFHRKNVAKLLK